MKNKFIVLVIACGFLVIVSVAISWVLVKKIGNKIPVSQVKPTPTQTVIGHLKITDEIQPVETWYIGQPEQEFKKTTPQPASRGFNHNMYEYYEVEHNKYTNSLPGKPHESVFYKIFSKDNDLKIESHIWIHGDNLQPDNCALYSFLESSSTMFIVCRDNSSAENSKGIYQILGYAGSESGANYHPRTMKLVLKETVSAKRGDFGLFFEISLSEVARQKYYLSTDEQIYMIQPDKTEKTLEMKEIPLNFYLVDDIENGPHPIAATSRGWAIDLIYNQNGNLVIFTGIKGGGILDILTDESLKVDKSCVENIDPLKKEEENFYNDRVDPFTEGPYKSVGQDAEGLNTYEQGVSTGGCSYREGYIRLYRSQDVGYCEITVKNELLGC